MRLRGLAAVLLVSCALVACGADATPSPVPTTATEPCEVGGTACGAEPVTTVPAGACGVVTTGLVTEALGVPATLLGQDPSGCGFAAGQWSLGVGAAPIDPVQGPGATGDVVNNDRSGLWQVHGSVVVDGVLYTYWLRNAATGSDTYPPVDGPAQKPITAAAAAALEQAITQAG